MLCAAHDKQTSYSEPTHLITTSGHCADRKATKSESEARSPARTLHRQHCDITSHSSLACQSINPRLCLSNDSTCQRPALMSLNRARKTKDEALYQRHPVATRRMRCSREQRCQLFERPTHNKTQVRPALQKIAVCEYTVRLRQITSHELHNSWKLGFAGVAADD
jgi:hypothetical protein